MKYQFAKGHPFDFYFWRDHQGLEVDLLKEQGEKQVTFEVKSSKTFRVEYVQNLIKWSQISLNTRENSHLIYAGDQDLTFQNFSVWGWRSLARCAQEAFESSSS